MNLPHAVRPYADQVVAVTDAVCREHLDLECADLCRDVVVRLSHFDTELMRRDLVESSPITWLLEVDGLLFDVRNAPLHVQVQAFELGLIPYVPGAPDDRP